MEQIRLWFTENGKYVSFFIKNTWKICNYSGVILAIVVNPWLGLMALLFQPLAVLIAVGTAIGYATFNASVLSFVQQYFPI